MSAAAAARERAYAPYSGFSVGAAVLAGDAIFSGCNVENASYGLTVCAERTAVFSAIAGGRRDLRAIALVTDAPEPTPPCGACRQVLAEFEPDLIVVSATTGGRCVVHHLSSLLPELFSRQSLSGDQTTGQ